MLEAVDDPSLAPTMSFGPFPIGARLAGRYEIRAPLGEGGMGAVYKVIDLELEEEVALKVLRSELSSSPDALARFRREVKLARRVTHTNIARTYDLGVHEGSRFITMELITGEALSVAAGRGIPLPEVLRVAQESCAGLVAAHAAGVVHRDLKPDNIMLTGSRVVLTDFGIARALSGDDAHATMNNIVGTPAYMAPEQVEGLAIDGRSDIYALGVMLFQLVTGTLPFGGDSPFAIAAARLTRPAPNARSVAPSVPDGVSALIASALERRREDRPDAATFAERLEILRGMRARPSAGGATIRMDLPSSAERSVVLRNFEGEPAELALAIESALADGLVGAKGVTFARERTLPAATGTLSVEGGIRASGASVRVRVRLVDRNKASVVWADQVDGKMDDTFGLEDAVLARVVPAILQRCGRNQGPDDPETRAKWEEAKQLFALFDPESVQKATRMAEDMLFAAPDNPWVMSLLALCQIRTFIQSVGADRSLFVQSEELALRAIDLDPSVSDAYHAIALIRSTIGDYRGVLHAEEEALRRNPLMAEAHYTVAGVLADTGHLPEALQRIELSLRLDPKAFGAHTTRTRILATMGRFEDTKRAIQHARELGGGRAIAIFESRLVYWTNDRARAVSLADEIEANAENAAWKNTIPMLRAYANGQEHEPVFEQMSGYIARTFGPRQQGFLAQVTIEYYGALGLRDKALAFMAKIDWGHFWDLGWLDNCAALTVIRDTPEFAEARARTAERVAQLFA